VLPRTIVLAQSLLMKLTPLKEGARDLKFKVKPPFPALIAYIGGVMRIGDPPAVSRLMLGKLLISPLKVQAGWLRPEAQETPKLPPVKAETKVV